MDLIARFRAKSLDEIFAYQTVKFLKIKDYRLGIFHHTLQVGIFLYMLVYTIIYEQRYLISEVPYGVIRATVQEPSWVLAETLPYCAQNQSSYNGQPNSDCAYMLGLDLTEPVGLVNSVFMGTEMKDTTYNLAPQCNSSALLTTSDCLPVKGDSVRHTIAGVEQYTIYMEHAITHNKRQIHMGQSSGSFHYLNGSQISFNDTTRTADILPIQTVLDAGGVFSLDESSSVNGSSFRAEGIQVILVVWYTNDLWGNFHYAYDVLILRDLQVLTKAHSIAIPGGFAQRTWYGVRVVFLVGGEVSTFDFLTLLSSLVNGIVLVKVATVVVDVVLQYFMPEKKIYNKHKFDITESFAKLRHRTSSVGDETSMQSTRRSSTEDLSVTTEDLSVTTEISPPPQQMEV